ncbi:hypothetical protein PsorP6_019239 [Peronosclerospora sorghi]|nr:hypothetical protein PsorP6_019239 [Peronosclerospora sorghi]
MSIVEMGTGSAYWARLLQLRGVDVIAYDVHTADDIDEEKESRKRRSGQYQKCCYQQRKEKYWGIRNARKWRRGI